MDRIRWTRVAVPAGALIALAWCLAGHSRAAPAAGQAQPDGKIYTNQPVFNLPIRLDERSRSAVSKVSLFARVGPGPWQLVDTAAPNQTQFRYQASQDGEYWFSVVTTDKQGLSTPRDVAQEPPALVVVVDTQKPAIELQPATLPGGELGLRCTIVDSNPDYQALKISYRAADQTVRYLEALPGQPGLFRVPAPEVLSGWVSVTAADRAHNETKRDLNLREVLGQGSAATQAPQSAPVTPAKGTASAPVSGPEIVQTSAQSPAPTHVASKLAPLAAVGSSGMTLPAPTPLPAPTTSKVNALPAPDAKTGGLPRQLINTTHASIDYRIDPVGPSGVSKVDVWMTADKGASWQRLGEDADRRSPAEVDLPGEGLYGIRLAVTNGNGFGGKPPAPGEAPTSWVEVDTTAPIAQLREIDPTTSGGKLELRWTVTDKNLGPEPIALYYATRREGPWLPIARNVKNDSCYHWEFPRDVGGQFFVRLEAADQAGNVSRCETPTPVVLDMTEPRALVVGISGMNAPGGTVQGH
jgi:hypothetical protein